MRGDVSGDGDGEEVGVVDVVAFSAAVPSGKKARVSRSVRLIHSSRERSRTSPVATRRLGCFLLSGELGAVGGAAATPLAGGVAGNGVAGNGVAGNAVAAVPAGF